ncbi:Protein kinase domain-containing protein [Aspergillus sclerotialis]|uniref:Protein kinase domain-containing protein n=1 Tax=Aspergillus sclerotialis TaxID=2070753 RepID=A0A3A2Z883_9EURO|nr:Protein kinase domain-containing protein [Aspergillus sclerotialis]
MDSQRVELVRNSYKEDKAYRRDDSEPCERSQGIIFRQNSLNWHIKVTFRGHNGIRTWKNKLARKKALERLIFLIDFSSLPLLGDTVTELVVERSWLFSFFRRLPTKSVDSSAGSLTDRFWTYSIREDDSRISEKKEKSSIMSFSYLGKANLASIKPLTVCFFYDPSHTTIFEKEVSYLRLFRGAPNIAQLLAIVTSQTPFKTNIQEDGPEVVTGILLEYYPNGTLEESIDQRDGRGSSWKSWPKQLALALSTLHCSGVTHMDIKPANVVLNAANEAVFIDIGVGYTYELSAPEIRQVIDPFGLPFETRRQCDLWSFGMLLIEIAQFDGSDTFGIKLQEIGRKLTEAKPTTRPNLAEVIHSLDS